MNHEKEQRTAGAILTAYGSYHVAMIDILNKIELVPELKDRIEQLRQGYNRQLSIDTQQNIRGEIEESERTILKACQYAQAFLIRDLRSLYPHLMRRPAVNGRVSRILSLAPGDMVLMFSESPSDITRLETQYRSQILDPESAAKVIGQLNSRASLTKFGAVNLIVDQVFKTRMEELSQAG